MSNLPFLDWQPVLLVKVTREPFTGTHCSLHVSRAHLALHPDGVVFSAWELPLEERVYPRIRLVEWKPLRDVPFKLPVRFHRQGDPRVSAIIPNGTWVLPYDEEQYRLYIQLHQMWQVLMTGIEAAPHSPYTLGFVRRLLAITTHSLSLN